jgi:hypothetical protein
MHSIFRWTTALMLALGMALTARGGHAAQIRQHAAGTACWYWANSTHRRARCWCASWWTTTAATARSCWRWNCRAENPVLRDYLNPMAGPGASTCTAARSGPCAMTSMMVAAAATCWR